MKTRRVELKESVLRTVLLRNITELIKSGRDLSLFQLCCLKDIVQARL